MNSKSVTVCWIGGWASNAACWDKDIVSLYPSPSHRFFDGHGLVNGSLSLQTIMDALTSRDCVAAWSMGSLAVHKWISELRGPPGNELPRIISISPVFNFCGQPGGWPVPVLNKMIRNLSRQKEQVLEEFFQRMTSRSHLTEPQAAAWKQQARSAYDTSELAAGLEFLMDTKVAPEQVTSRAIDISFVIDRQDPVSPDPGQLEIPDDRIVYHNGGHVPFLSRSEAIQKLLL